MMVMMMMMMNALLSQGTLDFSSLSVIGFECEHLSLLYEIRKVIRKRYLFCQKMVYKRVRGWNSGPSLPVLIFF